MIALVSLIISQIQPSQPAVASSSPTGSGSDILNVLLKTPAFWWVIVAGLFFLAHLFFRFRRLTYDPTWAEKLQERFDKLETKRAVACWLLREYRGKLTDEEHRPILCNLEPVLDFFEDLGFFVSGDQISAEVAHHYFYHWVRGYWNTSREYINMYRKEEPKTYKYIEPLFRTLVAKEHFWSRNKRRSEESPSKKEIDVFLEDEIRLIKREELEKELAELKESEK